MPQVNRVEIMLLQGIERQRETLLDNTRRAISIDQTRRRIGKAGSPCRIIRQRQYPRRDRSGTGLGRSGAMPCFRARHPQAGQHGLDRLADGSVVFDGLHQPDRHVVHDAGHRGLGQSGSDRRRDIGPSLFAEFTP